MTRAVVICPGRGTYNKTELGVLSRQHRDKASMFARFDEIRARAGQEKLVNLDAAEHYSIARHTRGDNASALIYAASYADFLSLKDLEIIAVTGNSMGWYTALACGGALSAENGFTVVNTMGTLMQEALIGGQLVYPVVDNDWRSDTTKRAAVEDLIADINSRPGRELGLSIDLGGMLVLAGNAEGLDDFTKVAAPIDQFPLRLANHAAFHTALQAPVSTRGRRELSVELFTQPEIPLVDGRGTIWWPGAATDTNALWDYTFGHQVTESYDFTRAITVAAREFAPDLFIITGPGTTLGGAVAQSLIQANWRGMGSKTDFQSLQTDTPFLISMGRDDQRGLVT
ncbi:hypothetical protein [uncultured Sneathiella sp.]|uniref:hypothetical protein n=1 Tax=uncultured Sneathiella sp. TaxID=879315 RepID=UPI0030EB15F2|tara:strand:- start:106257 stop:107282 length:1026 start_codon:yes stop_codon:yes gene_type:complete